MKIAFIGCGAMGGALIRGIIEKKAAEPTDVCVFDPDENKLEKLKRELGIVTARSEAEAADFAEIVFICVKPQITGTVSERIRTAARGKAVVSVAAGVTVSSYLDVLGSDAKIARCIPNLPAQTGRGITGVFFYNFGENDGAAKEETVRLLEAVGRVCVVKKEKMIDEMIALTSSSPAFFCIMVEAMADFGVKAGFTRQDALLLTELAMEGTAGYLADTGKHPAVLKDEVCSPGGTTIEGVLAMENNGFRNAVTEAMDACRKKAVKPEGYLEG